MNNLVQFLHLCVQSTQNFLFEICEILEKIKTDVKRLILVLIMKKNVFIYFAKIELFLNFATKNSLSSSVFILSTISQILKRKSCGVGTCNYSLEGYSKTIPLHPSVQNMFKIKSIGQPDHVTSVIAITVCKVIQDNLSMFSVQFYVNFLTIFYIFTFF